MKQYRVSVYYMPNTSNVYLHSIIRINEASEEDAKIQACRMVANKFGYPLSSVEGIAEEW